MATVYSKDGKTYTSGGLTYDASSGRPITSDGGFLLDQENNAVASTNKETSSNNNADGHKTKLFTYPVARKNDSETDYFMMEIAEYQAPGLNLPAFEVQGVQGAVKGDKLTEESVITGVVGQGKDGTFALKRGANSQAFTDPMEEKLSLIHIRRCRRLLTCRSRWSPYH